MKFRFKDHGANGLYVPGIDWGPRGIHIVRDFGDYVILKNPGHRAWDGIGMTSYFRTDYRIVKVLKWDADYAYVDEVGRPEEPAWEWRACIARMTELIEGLQSGEVAG